MRPRTGRAVLDADTESVITKLPPRSLLRWPLGWPRRSFFEPEPPHRPVPRQPPGAYNVAVGNSASRNVQWRRAQARRRRRVADWRAALEPGRGHQRYARSRALAVMRSRTAAPLPDLRRRCGGRCFGSSTHSRMCSWRCARQCLATPGRANPQSCREAPALSEAWSAQPGTLHPRIRGRQARCFLNLATGVSV